MTEFKNFSITATLYKGATTHVYRAVTAHDHQAVILKTTATAHPSPTEVARYNHEYRVLQTAKTQGLKGVVNVMDLIMHDHRPCLILEDSGGADLRTLQKSETFALDHILEIAVKIASALGEIYQAHIIHKDIKPSNILYNSETGVLKLIDFSSASIISRETPIVESSMLMTATLPYMSPEQTGRMNRLVDWRTDYYSFGVTLYELMTGRLPFLSTEPIELVHAHLALMPEPPHKTNAAIPPVLSDIILKLMSKDAENRYQGAFGIRNDLRQCLNRFNESGTIASFDIGQKDISDRLLIPQKLYGREAEINTLLAGFDEVSQGACKMVLVTGSAGIGKSALVHEVQRPLTQKTQNSLSSKIKKRYFISGKFDQLKKSTPYVPLIQAFQQIIRQILSESDTQISIWKENLLKALGHNGRVMIEVIPELELIIGSQPEVPIVGPAENVNRFNYVFENFIKTFASEDHPLVIFLDDLQWADDASLKLIEMFITVKVKYLYLIGAYRDNEVDPAHLLMRTLEEIEKSGAKVDTIQLELLKERHVSQLLAETFSCGLERSKSLAGLCFAKTRGNPFFLGQFIHSLYQDGLIFCNRAGGIWQWDEAGIRQTDITDNVVDLMVSTIQKLSGNTGYLLSLAACIGNRFDLNILSIVYGKPIQGTAEDLFPALQEELVRPMDESYKYISASIQTPTSDTISDHDHLPSVYRFLHDRVQQAAYSLIEEKKRPEVHLQIGREMLKRISQEAIEEHIFTMVDQLNSGSGLITDGKERENLAQLNLLAGKKAKLSAAYEPAFDYLKSGIRMLEGNCWQKQYGITLSLHEEAAEAAFLCGNYEKMEDLAEIVLQHAKTVLDKIKVYEIKIQACTAQNKLLDAVKTGLDVLKHLGITFPRKPNKLQILIAYLRTKFVLLGKQPELLINLQEMTDPYKLAAMRIKLSMKDAVYYTATELNALMMFSGVNLSVKYGNSPDSAYYYIGYGIFLSGFIGDINRGFKFGRLGLRLSEKLNAESAEGSAQLTFYCFIKHWKKHIRESLQPCKMGFQKSLESGNLGDAALEGYMYTYFSYFAGMELSTIEQNASRYNDIIRTINQKAYQFYNQRAWQIVLNLRGHNEDPTIITGDVSDEARALEHYQKDKNRAATCNFYIHKLILCYLFQQYDQAVENAAVAEKLLIALVGQYLVPLFHFYDSLAHLALFSGTPKTNQKQILRKVSKNQKKMKKWAYHAPMNYLHKWQLVEAERARILGKDEKAMVFYDQAIAGAKENLYIQEEALANELAAKFYLAKEETDTVRKYMTKARYCYDHWGARAKVDHLDQHYSGLLADVSVKTTQASINEKGLEPGDANTVTTTSNPVKGEQLDLTSVIKASQVISGEIEIKKLLSRIMDIIIENAGAQKGYLILKSAGDDRLRIEAQGHIDGKDSLVDDSIPMAGSGLVPESIIQYVVRTRESLVIADAINHHESAADAYIIQNHPKSILCAPLIHRNTIGGMVYLENNLTTGAFTTERVETISLLCSQAAISLENANLYQEQQQYAQTLEEKVAERTAELNQSLDTIKKTRDQLVQSEKMAALGGLVAGVAHEVNTPIGIAVSAASHLEDMTSEFVSKMASNQVKRADLNQYTKTAATASTLILKNLTNAVKIVQGFKQVAVDQTSGERREFRLKAYIEDVLLSLQPKLKKTRHAIRVDCPDDLLLNSYPGAFSQIISNLVMNSLIHGFDEMEAGEINFDVSEDTDSIELIYRDNGKGMNKKDLARIFDPFFTTNRSKGGSGLGMHIVHNLVTQTLGGSISCESRPDLGITLTIQIPMTEKQL